MSVVRDGRVMISPADALAMAGVMAIESFELGTVDLEVIRRALPAPLLAFILEFAQEEKGFRDRWQKADWLTRGELLREALLFVLTPAGAAVPS